MPSPRDTLRRTGEQAAIVQSVARLLIVEANAGAGKTTTLAMRIERALRDGTPPARILALAFSDAGREAMMKALPIAGIPPAVARQLRIATFDDFATARLRALQGEASRPRTPERVKPHVLDAIRRAREVEQTRHPDAFDIAGEGELAVESLLHAFRRIKGAMLFEQAGEEFMLTPASAVDVIGWDYTTLAVLRAYEGSRAGGLAADGGPPRFRYVDDAVYDLAKMLLSADPPFDAGNHPLQLGLSLIVVDEMHDMNRAMFTVLRGLLERNGDSSFVGVGDVDQVVHTEAAADAWFMRDGFDIEAGRAARLRLTASYRCGGDAAALLARHAQKAYEGRHDRNTRVELLRIDDARALRLRIEQALNERHGLQPRSPHAELAVLLRHPSRSVALENELLDAGVGYLTYGFDSYLRRPEVLFVRAVLCCALEMLDGVESPDVRQQLIHALMLFAGVSIRTSMEGASDDAVAGEWETIARLATGEGFVRHTLPAMLERMPESARGRIQCAMAMARTARVEELGQVVAALDVGWFASRVLVHSAAVTAARESVAGLVEGARGFESIASLLRGTSERELALDQMRRKRAGIRLSTIEAAKGLEFDHVILPGVDAGGFDGGHPDDRNLFYVGASRARHLLTLTHGASGPSRYLQAVS